jgi:rhodanese-related sulfurtransferase
MNLFKQSFGGSSTVNLKELIKEGAFIVDVRTPGEFASGYAKGSVNIPLDKVASQLDRFKNKKHYCLLSKRRQMRSGENNS